MTARFRYAIVNGQKIIPFPKGRGECPCCGGLLIAKCGQINAHHWAHDAIDDCDAWSEAIGPWHLWWQDLVILDAREVVRVPHRADVVGNDGVVVELQHSRIDPEDIAAREAFYGNMVWLFDATHRFAYMKSAERAFFTVGQTKHLDLCKKPVFLDFGFHVVQVETFNNSINKVSGFGLIRSREWFAETFLSEILLPESNPAARFKPGKTESDPWRRKSPLRKLDEATVWIDPNIGQQVTFPQWTEYLALEYGKRTLTGDRWDFEDVIDRHPAIANGWAKDQLVKMQDFFCGKIIILGGLLRLLPTPLSSLPADRTVGAVQQALAAAEDHVRVGRMPIMDDGAKQTLVENAKQYEIQRYGRTIDPHMMPKDKSKEEKSLFD